MVYASYSCQFRIMSPAFLLLSRSFKNVWDSSKSGVIEESVIESTTSKNAVPIDKQVHKSKTTLSKKKNNSRIKVCRKSDL